MQSSIKILDIENSFSWIKNSFVDRIPSQLKKHGFAPERTHLYQIVALNSFIKTNQTAGVVEFPRDTVMKSTYTSIDKGLNINHKIKLNLNFKHVIIDAEFESDRQEYVVADEDPEIFRLVQEGKITAVSVQGTPRYYVENCGHCTTGNCQCKLVPEGLNFGIRDGIALAYVATKDCEYYGQKIPGEPPADKNTTISIMMTDHTSKSISLQELENMPREKLHLISLKEKMENISMSATTKTPEEKIDGLQKEHEEIKQSVSQLQTQATEVQNSIDVVKNSVDEIKNTVTSFADLKNSIDEIKNSMKSLTATDDETKMKVEEVKNTAAKLEKEIKSSSTNPDVLLSEHEKKLAKDEIIKNTPLQSFIQ